jgi:pyruvate kinase
VSFEALPRVVKKGDALFVGDGIIQLEVVDVEGADVLCRTVAGGELRSRKGLNLPGIDLGISAFTAHDRACLDFALEHGVDAVSQSFVERASDLEAVRAAAEEHGRQPFLVAKIERAGALERLDEILDAADGIMVARGDLGVEIPIARIAVVQKDVIWRARMKGKPVITATHMLESMCESRRPTRAEATDVANAILDGTDCVMLSGESAVGRYPVESVAMLARIAEATEPQRDRHRIREALRTQRRYGTAGPVDLIALSVHYTLERSAAAAVIVPTVSGTTARNVTRFRLPVWILGVSPREATCCALNFSYGVHPHLELEHPTDWKAFALRWMAEEDVHGDMVILTEGPSEDNPDVGHRMELLSV